MSELWWRLATTVGNRPVPVPVEGVMQDLGLSRREAYAEIERLVRYEGIEHWWEGSCLWVRLANLVEFPPRRQSERKPGYTQSSWGIHRVVREESKSPKVLREYGPEYGG